MEWQVAGACNYDCSYCIQSVRYRRGRPDADAVERTLALLAGLPGVWEIKCSGGEAFAHPAFMARIVPGLMDETPHAISVLTNFSSSRAELMQFARRTRDRLRVFSASLHLEHVEAEAFLDKAAWFLDLLGPEVDLVVNQVVLPGREAEAARCKALAEARGLRWFAQLYKVDGGVAEYPDRRALLPILGADPDPRAANLAPSYRGRLCWAGVDYFTIDKDGDAWSCRTAKRHRAGHLGNVHRGELARLAGPAVCPWDICPCSVPANRGMIEGVAPRGRAAEASE